MLKNPYPMVRLEPARALGGAREVGGPRVSLSGLLGGRPGIQRGVTSKPSIVVSTRPSKMEEMRMHLCALTR